jgi:hypothetical protein
MITALNKRHIVQRINRCANTITYIFMNINGQVNKQRRQMVGQIVGWLLSKTGLTDCLRLNFDLGNLNWKLKCWLVCWYRKCFGQKNFNLSFTNENKTKEPHCGIVQS